MTRERTKELLPLIQAWADGRTIQVKFVGESDDYFRNVENVFSIDWEQEDLVYRIKKEPKYVPFDNAKEMYEAVRKHGVWVHLRFEDSNDYYAIHTIYKDGVLIGDDNADNEREFYEMVKDFVWADDGTPVGKLSNAENLAD